MNFAEDFVDSRWNFLLNIFSAQMFQAQPLPTMVNTKLDENVWKREGKTMKKENMITLT